MARSTNLLIASFLGLSMLGSVPACAQSQGSQAPSTISIDLDSVDVREALRAIFKSVGVSYSIASEVQGTVTINVKNVPFETALLNVLRQVGATYRIEAGIYQIMNREPVITVPVDPVQAPPDSANKHRRKVFVRSMDPMLFAALAGHAGGQTNFNQAPEMSTVLNGPNNGGMGNGGFGNNGFGGSNGFNGSNGSGNGTNGPGTGNRGNGNGRNGGGGSRG